MEESLSSDNGAGHALLAPKPTSCISFTTAKSLPSAPIHFITEKSRPAQEKCYKIKAVRHLE